MKLNSVVFHTSQLALLREFYEGKLGLTVGTYVRENKTVEDCSDSYVNYYLGDCLLSFEEAPGRTDVGSVIFTVPDFAKYREDLEKKGVTLLKNTDRFFKIKDLEGRSILIEAEVN